MNTNRKEIIGAGMLKVLTQFVSDIYDENKDKSHPICNKAANLKHTLNKIQNVDPEELDNVKFPKITSVLEFINEHHSSSPNFSLGLNTVSEQAIELVKKTLSVDE